MDRLIEGCGGWRGIETGWRPAGGCQGWEARGSRRCGALARPPRSYARGATGWTRSGCPHVVMECPGAYWRALNDVLLVTANPASLGRRPTESGARPPTPDSTANASAAEPFGRSNDTATG
jgi:hypothetical protein